MEMEMEIEINIDVFNCLVGVFTWMYDRPVKLSMCPTGTVLPESLHLPFPLHGMILLSSGLSPIVNFLRRLS